ncbi:kelch repeat-containing protein [Seonamhaeicola sp. ML3]|uniref:Kelch repeat-containing protein n=1 Tax=Seonamhaeicola sp. ML3 TaxID=2937786 RepID=UPI00200BD862|nr:kelch repeat-containing protein [Seonamhaeicola sp. ML3]
MVIRRLGLGFLLLGVFFSCKTPQQNPNPIKLDTTYEDQWIDKDENENYTARHECSFVQAGNRFYMFGGRESAEKLEIYDFTHNTWKVAQNKAPKQFNHFQATFYKGFIWVIGAFKTNKFPREIPEDNVWLYFPPTDTWIKGPEIPKERRRGGAGLVVYEDKFYVVGGNTRGHDGGYVNWFDEYDPEKNIWTILDDASQARDHFSAAVIDHKLYAAAGRQSGGFGGVFAPLVKIVDVFDFKTKTWSTLKKDIPTPRAAPGVAVLNKELFVMGGEGEKKGPAYKVVEAYNTKTDNWEDKADMHYPRHGTQAILSGKGIYITGGSPKRGGGRQLNMEVYNEDRPHGQQIKASYLAGPEKFKIDKGTSAKIEIKNKAGNTASFINSIELTGKNASAFKIESIYDLTLVDVNISFSIALKHSSQKQGETANLEITYNGNSKKIITLVSH